MTGEDNKQDWNSETWTMKDGTKKLVSELSLIELLQAIWALHLLVERYPTFLDEVYESNLWASIMEVARDHLTELQRNNNGSL